MIAARPFPTLLLVIGTALSLGFGMRQARAQQPFDLASAERAERHQSADWLAMVPHLPDPQTGSPQELELAADVLRARRMPEDALDFYTYALKRGGDEAKLRNRLGVTELELHETMQAQAEFKRALLLNRNNAESWNNLGAAEYVSGNFAGAIKDYQRAIKLNKKSAIFHSNLGTAYFERGDYESARSHFVAAMKLDPGVFQRGGWGGVQAHVMSPKDRGKFCFEMARLSARNHDEETVIRWLAQAIESGYDIQSEMHGDRDLDSYRQNPKLQLIVQNAKSMRAGQAIAAGGAPALPAETPKIN